MLCRQIKMMPIVFLNKSPNIELMAIKLTYMLCFFSTEHHAVIDFVICMLIILYNYNYFTCNILYHNGMNF